MGQEPAGTEGGQEPAPTTQEPANGGGKEPQTFDEAYVKEIRAEAARYRTSAKELADRLKEFEDRDKSDLEKLTDTATTAEQRAAKAEARLARIDVCHEVGLDPKHAGRLQGSTPEELKQDAEEFRKALGGEARVAFDGGAREKSAPTGGMDAVIRRAGGRR